MPDHVELDELAAYALGALSEPERQRLAAHVRSCAACSSDFGELSALVAALPQVLTTARVPDSAWTAIQSRIRQAGHRKAGFFPKLRFPSMPFVVQPALIALLVLAVAGLIGWNTSLQRRSSSKPSIVAGDTVIALVQQGGSGSADGHLIMSEDRREGGLVVSGLPALSAGRRYQVWFLRPDMSRASAGTFQVDAYGQAVAIVVVPQPASDFNGVAVTDEPESGSPTPTGRDLLAGPIYE